MSCHVMSFAFFHCCCLTTKVPSWTTAAHLGPGVLLAEQVSIEVGHLPVLLVCEAPHQLPVAHVMKLLPLLLSLTALLKIGDSLETHKTLRLFMAQ